MLDSWKSSLAGSTPYGSEQKVWMFSGRYQLMFSSTTLNIRTSSWSTSARWSWWCSEVRRVPESDNCAICVDMNFIKLWEYLLCTKKTKITLFNNFFSMLVSAAHSREHHNAFLWLNRCSASGLYIRTCMWFSHEHVSKTDSEEKKLLNKFVIFVFSVHKIYFRSFITLRLSHYCHMDYYNDVLTTLLGLEDVSCIAVYAGSESSRIE